MPYDQIQRPHLSFQGIWVPLITPFKDGDVDCEAASNLTQHLLKGGLHGLVVGGTTGEGASLSDIELARLLHTVAATVNARCPVLMGLEGPNTQKLAEKVWAFRNLPHDGYLMPAPSYVRPSQDGIYQHFLKVADSARKPIVIYDIPARTGVEILPDTVYRLSEAGPFPAIKACGLSQNKLKDLLAIPHLKVLSGDDAWLLKTLEMGGHGGILASAHIMPDRFVEIYDLMRRGDLETASQKFDQLQPLITALFSAPNPAPVKSALALQGWIDETLRLPMLPIDDHQRHSLNAIMSKLTSPKRSLWLCPDKSCK